MVLEPGEEIASKWAKSPSAWRNVGNGTQESKGQEFTVLIAKYHSIQLSMCVKFHESILKG